MTWCWWFVLYSTQDKSVKCIHFLSIVWYGADQKCVLRASCLEVVNKNTGGNVSYSNVSYMRQNSTYVHSQPPYTARAARNKVFGQGGGS